MLSTKAKRNVWLVMTALSVGIIVDRIMRLIDGSIEWTGLASGIAVFVLVLRGYICFRRRVREESME